MPEGPSIFISASGDPPSVFTSGDLHYDPETKVLMVNVDGRWETVGPAAPDSPTTMFVLVPNHPHAYTRDDGKTQCPDCHAVSLDRFALSSLPCRS